MGLFDFFKNKNDKDVENSTDFEEEYDYLDDDYEDESLNVYDAADTWFSNGMDEDYTFGYSEEELRRALED
ncbi:hypothetical protein [Streptococcus mutans]|uniref:hypothetical protein n=1 Tax=Streptococcus mutans TaxID=1309 RepID=UPI002741AFAD|nr:hypothetical protein [Streptococcus mutans]MDP5874030.1 hypothetical protein [Streptococcus mutans]